MAVDTRPATPAGAGAASPRRPRAARLLSLLAWTLIGLGVLVGLYLIYSLFFTNLQTAAAQDELLQDWAEQVGPTGDSGGAGGSAENPADAVPDGPAAGDPVAERGRTDVADPPEPGDDAATADDPVVGEAAPAAPPGEAVALVWFERPGAPPPVTDEPYVVLSGVTLADLARGPGHYPGTAAPGADGNFAVAGHRTTHGAPFFNLDDLTDGDEIHVMDTDGRTHVYAFAEQRIVPPTRVSVLNAEPFGIEGATITLTTCHPRFSNRERLVVVGELQT